MPNLYLMVLKELLAQAKELADTKAGLAIIVFICCSFWFVAYTEQADKQQEKMLGAFDKANTAIVEAIKEANSGIVDIKHSISYLSKDK